MTMIEGSQKERDKDGEFARYHLAALFVEIFRAVARGDDRQHRVLAHLAEFSQYASRINASLPAVVGEVVEAAHRDAVALNYERFLSRENDIRLVIESALRLAAEAMCHDNCARARASRREDALLRYVDRLSSDHGERSSCASPGPASPVRR